MGLKAFAQAQLGLAGAVFPHDLQQSGRSGEGADAVDRGASDGVASARLGELQCLVAGVDQRAESTNSLVDATTQCAVVTIVVLPKKALAETLAVVPTDNEAKKTESGNAKASAGADDLSTPKEAANGDPKNGVSIPSTPSSGRLESQLLTEQSDMSLGGLRAFLDEVVDLNIWYSDSESEEDTECKTSPQDVSLGAIAEKESQKGSSKTSQRGTAQKYLLHVLKTLYQNPEVVKIDNPKGIREFLGHDALPQAHQNWLPVWKVLEAKDAYFVLCGWTPYTLESMVKFNYHTLRPAMLPSKRPARLGELALSAIDSASDEPLRFVLFQLVRTIAFMHEKGLYHGNLRPQSIYITNDFWVWVMPPLLAHEKANAAKIQALSPHVSLLPRRSVNDIMPFSLGLTEAWRRGHVSNLDYLMAINAAAGRHMADANFHPVIPWVTDFSSSDLEDGERPHWRDLTRSKYRLVKGDDQLDITFRNSPTPHHITESLSEITFYIYMARITPLATLRSVVRSNFEAKEYPASMARMYEWTPDECIPEFFCDASVFSSMHTDIDLPDLQFPEWCKSAQEFVDWHRSALESPHVSQQLHHWIDLNFGYKLSGRAAEESKNVTLPLSSLPQHRLRKSPGFVQVFTEPHPPRQFENQDRLGSAMDAFEQGARFERAFGPMLAPTYELTRTEGDEDLEANSLLRAKQADDYFSLACIAAEMYLRQPLLTDAREKALRESPEDAMHQVLPEINKLPLRVRSFVSEGLRAKYCDDFLLQNDIKHSVFPTWFDQVYQFLAEYQARKTWHARLEWMQNNLGDLLICLSSDPAERRQALNLILPSILAIMHDADDPVRAIMPIQFILIVGRVLDVREFLPTVVDVYEAMQAKSRWELLHLALDAEICLRVLGLVGCMAFAATYVPFLVETLRSTSAPYAVQNTAAETLIAIARSPDFGIGQSVRTVLPLLLRRFQIARGVGTWTDRDICVHLKQFGPSELSPIKLTALLDKYSSIIDSTKIGSGGSSSGDRGQVGPSSINGASTSNIFERSPTTGNTNSSNHGTLGNEYSTSVFGNFASSMFGVGGPARPRSDLFLPVEIPTVKVIRYIAARSGRAVVMELVFPAAFRALEKTCDHGDDVSDKQRAWIRRMDILSLLSCVVSLLEEEDLYKWFLERSDLRELLGKLPGPVLEEQLSFIYVAVLLGLVVNRIGHHEIAPVLEASADSLRAAAVPRCALPQLWVARFIFAAFETRWGEERIRAYYPSLAPSNLRRLLAIPDAYRRPDRDKTIGDASMAPTPPLGRQFGSDSQPAGGLHITTSLDNGDGSQVELDEEEDEFDSEEILLVDANLPRTGDRNIESSPPSASHSAIPELQRDPSVSIIANSKTLLHASTSEKADDLEAMSSTSSMSSSLYKWGRPASFRRTLSAAVGSDEVGVREENEDSQNSLLHSERSRAQDDLESQTHREETWLIGPEQASASESSDIFMKRKKRGTLLGAVSDSFEAHQSPLITLEANEDETLLATSSRSSSLKLFSITGTPRELARFRNVRPVSSIRFLDLGRKCLLLDGAVRLWDTEYGHERTREVGSPPKLRTVPIGMSHRPVLTAETPGQQSRVHENIIWISTIAGTIDCLDFRVPGYLVSSHMLPMGDYGSGTSHPGEYCAGSVVCGGNFAGGWVAAGRASGHVSVLDARTGGVLAHWKAHEAGVVSLKALHLSSSSSQEGLVHESAAYQLLSLSSEGSARVWDVSLHGGFENAGEFPWSSQRRPACRIRVGGLPRTARFSRVLAPQLKSSVAPFQASNPLNNTHSLSHSSSNSSLNDSHPVPKISSLLGTQPGILSSRFLSTATSTSQSSNARVRSASDDDVPVNVSPVRADNDHESVMRANQIHKELGTSHEGAVKGLHRRSESVGLTMTRSLPGGHGLEASQHGNSSTRYSVLDASSSTSSANAYGSSLSPDSTAQQEGFGVSTSNEYSSTQSPTSGMGVSPSVMRNQQGQLGNANARRGTRVYVSLPQCDTANVWRDTSPAAHGNTRFVIGSDNRLSVVSLELRPRAVEVTAKPISLRDATGELIPRGTMRITTLRVLPMHGTILAGGDTGHIHTII